MRRIVPADPSGRLRHDVAALLIGLDLVRVDADRWLFSPAVARWPAPKPKAPRPKAKPAGDTHPAFDLGVPDDADLD